MESLQQMAMKAAVNRHEFVQKLGRVQELRIDSNAKVVDCSLLLKGEEQAIQLQIRYQVQETHDQKGISIEVKSLECNREWIAVLFNSYVEEKGKPRITLQGFVAKAVGLFL